MNYNDFLLSKDRMWRGIGIDSRESKLPSMLFDWQKVIVQWALKKGRAAVFADCGLGKSFIQLSWARALNVPTIIVAPLCVAEQTIGEAAKLGFKEIIYARTPAEINGKKIVITNYERIDAFDPLVFKAVVLDESSILKSFDGKTRDLLIDMFKETPYRLCCTATPAPNDVVELANHSEFLGISRRKEFLATWFVNKTDAKSTANKWRLKGHGVDQFYEWMSSWACAVSSPIDIGYSDKGYRLPKLTIRERVVGSRFLPGSFFPDSIKNGIQGRLAARFASLPERVDSILALVRADNTQWILWCGLNSESDALEKAFGAEAVNVKGGDSYESKIDSVKKFLSGQIRVLITKPKILGFGMNFQHCHRMAFVGLSDSYETYYQCIRRCWRFGQKNPVDVFIVVSYAELPIVWNVQRKEVMASQLPSKLCPFWGKENEQ